MDFSEAVEAVLRKYAVFHGRSLRSEYWFWTLFCVVASFLIAIIDTIVFGPKSIGPFGVFFSLATFLPSLAVGIRRLHDIDKTGWWTLISFTIVGIIPLIYWACQPSTPGDNDYGRPAPTKP